MLQAARPSPFHIESVTVIGHKNNHVTVYDWETKHSLPKYVHTNYFLPN